jgi:hypothetical protein
MDKLKPLNFTGEKLHEPYMPVKDGFGFLGVVLYDEVEDKVQCHVCGKMFQSLTRHTEMHRLSAREYKEKFGLNYETPLCRPATTEKNSMRGEFFWRLNHGKVTLKEIHEKAVKMGKLSKREKQKNGKHAWRTLKKHKLTAEMMNRFGTCPAQIEERFIKIVDFYGRAPSWDEVLKSDKSLMPVICRRYKSYSNFLTYFGLKGKRRVTSSKYTKRDIEMLLTKFVHEHKRLPNPKDTKIGYLPDYMTIEKYFGTWKKAKLFAFDILEKEYPIETDNYDKKLRRIRYFGKTIVKNNYEIL